MFIRAHRNKTFCNGKRKWRYLLDQVHSRPSCFSPFVTLWTWPGSHIITPDNHSAGGGLVLCCQGNAKTQVQHRRGTVRALEHTTGGWWHLNWVGGACGNGWSRISGMVSNTSNTWFDAIPFTLFQPLLWAILPSAAPINNPKYGTTSQLAMSKNHPRRDTALHSCEILKDVSNVCCG